MVLKCCWYWLTAILPIGLASSLASSLVTHRLQKHYCADFFKTTNLLFIDL
jgi:hypothetical protein